MNADEDGEERVDMLVTQRRKTFAVAGAVSDPARNVVLLEVAALTFGAPDAPQSFHRFSLDAENAAALASQLSAAALKVSAAREESDASEKGQAAPGKPNRRSAKGV